MLRTRQRFHEEIFFELIEREGLKVKYHHAYACGPLLQQPCALNLYAILTDEWMCLGLGDGRDDKPIETGRAKNIVKEPMTMRIDHY